MVKICLNMIVKNESRIIHRCFNTLLSIIDYIVVTDTGSTDNTIQLMEEYIQNHPTLQGKIYEKPFKNFGFSRTNSIENAKEYLQSIGEDLSQVYLLFVDADMKLVISPDFKKEDLAKIQVGQIIQKNDKVKYYNTRICRADVPIKCVGVTHEYYSVPNEYRNTKVDTIFIDDIGDGGAKADKFSRDIRLLEEGLREEPHSDRYHFYLAQSYHCIGQQEKAIEFYEKRIALGGWREEIYHSHYTIGNIYKDSLKDWKKAAHHYLLSFEKSGGVRGEGLMKMVEYYKDKKEYHLAMIFLEKLFKLSYPKDDVLFIDYHVYSYKPLYEFSIIAYYINRKHDGLMASTYLCMDKSVEVPHHIKDNIRKNTIFYIEKLPTTYIKRIENVLLSQYYNPSSSSFTIKDMDKKLYEGIFRTVNYTITDKGHYVYPPHMNYIHTENYWVEMKEHKFTRQIKIQIAENCEKEYYHEYYAIQGLEDGRHVWYKDEVYISFTSFEYGKEAKASLVLAHMNKETCEIDKVVHLKYETERIQKNWVPFVYQDKLCFVYSYAPFIILEVNPQTGECTEILRKENTNYDLSELRGSAPPIWLKDEEKYLIMTHEVIFADTRKYVHRFLLFDKEFNLLDLSEVFYFHHLFIEFSLSIMYDENTKDIIIPYSYKDGESFLCQIPFNKIPWLPKDFKRYFELM
jgi:hypothetical protein